MDDLEPCAAHAEDTFAQRMLGNLGYFGHFLHMHTGGRNGKQHILMAVYQNGGQLAQNDLARRSCVSSAALSEVISKLEAEGLVTRNRSASDGRVLEIELTGTGSERAQQMMERKLAFEGEAFSCLTDDERDELAHLLDRIAAHWRAIDDREKDEARA